jgi:lipopolysaccharide transport system permease protein
MRAANLPSSEQQPEVSTDVSSRRIVVYSSKSQLRTPVPLLREIFAELWQFRELSWILFTRDLRAHYRQNYLGYFWLFAPVVTNTLIWVFLSRSQVIQIAETSIPYPAYVLVGSLIWGAFSASVTQPLTSFAAGQSVFTRLNVPTEAFMFSGLARVVFDLLIRLSVVIPVFLFLGINPVATAPLFFFGLACTILIGFSIGLLLVPLGSLYSDVGRVVETGLGVGMYLAPVVYPPPTSGWARSLVDLNPLTAVIVTTRDWLTLGHSGYVLQMLAMTFASCLLLLAGLVVCRVALPNLIERMGM